MAKTVLQPMEDGAALRTLSLPEAMEETGLSERTLRRLVAERALPVVKVGRRVRFRPADIAAYLDAHTRPAAL